MKTRDFSFGVGILDYKPAPDDELRVVLERWAQSFREDPFTSNAYSKGVAAWSVGYRDAAKNIDLLTDRLAGILSELASLPAASAGSTADSG